MKKKKVIPVLRKIFPVLILIATLLMSVGYASLNSVLINISGEIIAKEVSGVYITEVNYQADIGADIVASEILNAYQTNLTSKIVLSDTNPLSSITYTINIINTTDKTQVFNGVEYLPEDYSNNDITYSLNGLTINDELSSGQDVTFTITFYYSGNTLSSNNILESMINFDFSEKQSNTLRDKILANNTIITTPPTLNTASVNSPNEPSGLYMSTETNTNEPTYYFRGEVLNNNIKFAGLDWKIVRINEDGSVRLMSKTYVKSRMQQNTNNYRYMYFTYDDGTTDYWGQGQNKGKLAIDNWYNANIVSAGFDSYVLNGKFCEQAKVKKDDATSGENATMTIYTNYVPNFKCEVDGNGHGEVNLKVGLITYDELVFAGAYPGNNNQSFHLLGTNYMWTMSPAGFKLNGMLWGLDSWGEIIVSSTGSSYNMYPVINIDGSHLATGDGYEGSEYELILS